MTSQEIRDRSYMVIGLCCAALSGAIVGFIIGALLF